MVTYVNIEKLKKLKARNGKSEPINVNFLSAENADHSILLIAKMFSMRKGNYNIKFWVGGSPVNKGYLFAECNIESGKVEFLGE